MKVVGRPKNRVLAPRLVGHKHSSSIQREVLGDRRACCRRTRGRDTTDDVMMNENILLSEIQFWQLTCGFLCNEFEVCCICTLVSLHYRFSFSSSTILTTHALCRREGCRTFGSPGSERHVAPTCAHTVGSSIRLIYSVDIPPCSSIWLNKQVISCAYARG